MWRVLVDFADLQDNGHVYRAGDEFPRGGTVEPGRAAELASSNNRRGFPLIEEVVSSQPEKPQKPPKTKK